MLGGEFKHDSYNLFTFFVTWLITRQVVKCEEDHLNGDVIS